MVKARRSDCPINIALELFGDRWSLLIIRDLMLKGRTTFRDLLEGGEGIATNVLADRLDRLEASGMIERLSHPTDGRRQIFRLTAKSIALAPVIVELIIWAADHEPTAAPAEEVAAMKADRPGTIAAIFEVWRRRPPER